MNTQNNFSSSDSSVFNHPFWNISAGDYIPRHDETAPSLFQFRLAENIAYNGFLFTFSIAFTSLAASILILL